MSKLSETDPFRNEKWNYDTNTLGMINRIFAVYLDSIGEEFLKKKEKIAGLQDRDGSGKHLEALDFGIEICRNTLKNKLADLTHEIDAIVCTSDMQIEEQIFNDICLSISLQEFKTLFASISNVYSPIHDGQYIKIQEAFLYADHSTDFFQLILDRKIGQQINRLKLNNYLAVFTVDSKLVDKILSTRIDQFFDKIESDIVFMIEKEKTSPELVKKLMDSEYSVAINRLMVCLRRSLTTQPQIECYESLREKVNVVSTEYSINNAKSEFIRSILEDVDFISKSVHYKAKKIPLAIISLLTPYFQKNQNNEEKALRQNEERKKYDRYEISTQAQLKISNEQAKLSSIANDIARSNMTISNYVAIATLIQATCALLSYREGIIDLFLYLIKNLVKF